MNLLLLAALFPPLYLLYRVYKDDKIEREPIGLIALLFFFGILTTIPAAWIEGFFSDIVKTIIPEQTVLFLLIENFLIVAWAEEGVKHFALKRGSWNKPAFNYQFDAIVYAAAVSLGFAALENVMYVFSFDGLGTAIIRSFTAIPGHCIFGIFMGFYYGYAKYYSMRGDRRREKHYQRMSILVPLLLHGMYDFLASFGGTLGNLFWVYLIGLDIVALMLIHRASKADRPL